jgi:hypothetical protein
VSEQMPEITAEEARVLEELDQLRQDDPEGYAAMIGDLEPSEATDPATASPRLAHAEEILGMLDAGMQGRDEQLADLFNAAWRQAAEADNE